jgi:hypothetical protein
MQFRKDGRKGRRIGNKISVMVPESLSFVSPVKSTGAATREVAGAFHGNFCLDLLTALMYEPGD